MTKRGIGVSLEILTPEMQRTGDNVRKEEEGSGNMVGCRISLHAVLGLGPPPK